MAELRYTDTNSGDDAKGRAFGLEGNLYLPVVAAVVAAFGLFALAAFPLHLPYPLAGVLGSLPLSFTVAWVMLLKQGKPAGYDRDWLECQMGDCHFTRVGRTGVTRE